MFEVKKKERETERDRERQRDRQRQRKRETERKRERERERETLEDDEYQMIIACICKACLSSCSLLFCSLV